MTFSITVDKRGKKVLADIPKHLKKHRRGLNQALYEIGTLVGRETDRILTSGRRTGRLYMFRGSPHRASAFGEPPANRSGRLVRSYDYKVSGWHTLRVGEGAPYAKFLELGTKFMKPRQHLILAINNKAGDTLNAFLRYTNGEIKRV